MTNTAIFSSVLLPHCIIVTPLIAFGEGHPCFSWNIERKPVVLQFAEGKLSRWEVLPDPRGSFWDQQSNYSQDGQSLSEWMDQNQGNDLFIENDKWYYIEVHIKLNDPGINNAIYELWMDDCGTDGLGCTGSGTLR